MKRPNANEYNPYFQRYIDLTGAGDFLELLKSNTAETVQYFTAIPEDKQSYRYEQGKWTIKEVLMHIIDTERVFIYRALVAGRGDSETPLHKMDPDLYVKGVDVSMRSMDSLVNEFKAVRAGTQVFYENLTDEHSERIGNNGAFPITPRALGYIIMGHIHHHMQIINERYL